MYKFQSLFRRDRDTIYIRIARGMIIELTKLSQLFSVGSPTKKKTNCYPMGGLCPLDKVCQGFVRAMRAERIVQSVNCLKWQSTAHHPS